MRKTPKSRVLGQKYVNVRRIELVRDAVAAMEAYRDACGPGTVMRLIAMHQLSELKALLKEEVRGWVDEPRGPYRRPAYHLANLGR